MCVCVCVCVCVRMCVTDQEQDTASFIRTAIENLLPNESQGMFFCVLLCRRCVLSDLMSFDVLTKVTPLFFFGLHKSLFETFYQLLTQTNAHIRFTFHQQRRNPKSTGLNNGHRQQACIISPGHSVTLLSSVFTWSIFSLQLREHSWNKPVPVLLFTCFS